MLQKYGNTGITNYLLTLHGEGASLGGQLKDLIISCIHACAINVANLALHQISHSQSHCLCFTLISPVDVPWGAAASSQCTGQMHTDGTPKSSKLVTTSHRHCCLTKRGGRVEIVKL